MAVVKTRSFWLSWCEKYLNEVRPQIDLSSYDPALLLTNLGEAFTPNRMTQLVRGHINAAEIGKSGSCYLFRRNLSATIDAVADDHEPVLITRSGGKPAAVLMSLGDFAAFEETRYLLSSPENSKRLLKAVE